MDTGKKTTSQIIQSHTLTYFNLLNVVLAVLILISGQYKNMLFMGIVFSNTLIGIIQELKVKSLIDRLSVITATKAKKIVNNKEIPIPIEKIAVGDVLLFVSGDQIVSDSTVLSSDGLEVNESLLTGESAPVLKRAGDTLYSGSFVVAGSGTARVAHIGDDNYATQLVKKARTKKRASSELQDSIKKIIRYVSYAIIPIGITLFCIQYFRAEDTLSNSLVSTVAGVLGMIPEGLVLLTSVSFILGVGRLAGKKALVQEMEAIEALARVDVLCLDKTGTITTGDLTVEKVVPLDTPREKILRIMEGMAYAFPEANATTQALQRYFDDTKPYEILDAIPFSSGRKFMAISARDPKQKSGLSETVHYFLGAPDFLSEDPVISKKARHYSDQGLRILLLGSAPELAHAPSEIRGFRPIAFIVLSDCIKKEASAAFRFFSEQDVDIKVISGDDPVATSYIAKQTGVLGAEDYIDARELSEDPDTLRQQVSDYTIYGRVTPEKKQDIIRACQSNDHLVGMVGDGINDVLALKDSDCGIAMANGADAAKHAAHIVLMDSNFASLPAIVREGRTIIANIERVSALYLTKTIYSVLLCIIFIIIGRSYPFIPIQLSLISVTGIGVPSFFLALEHHDKVTTSGFLRHVLRISLPFAIAMTLCICMIQLVATPLNLSDLAISTCNLLIGGLFSLLTLIRVCYPWTRRRTALIICVSCVFAVSFWLFPDFFGIMQLPDLRTLYHFLCDIIHIAS